MIKIKKETNSTIQEVGSSSHKFYGYLFYNHKRMGTVWAVKGNYVGSRYIFNEDFDRYRHSANTRPTQITADTLKDLKEEAQYHYEMLGM